MAGLSQNAIMEYVMKQPGSRPLSRQTGSVGYDLAACNALKIPGNGFSLVNTGLQLVIPEGHVGQVCSRSGLAANHGITAQAGVIDPNYRGEIKVRTRGHVTLHFAVSVGLSICYISDLRADLLYCSYPNVSDWISVYPALFFFRCCCSITVPRRTKSRLVNELRRSFSPRLPHSK